jgi:hypothetical protein
LRAGFLTGADAAGASIAKVTEQARSSGAKLKGDKERKDQSLARFWERNFLITGMPPPRRVTKLHNETAIGSRHPPRSYDEETLSALEPAFSDAWAVLEAREPLRDWVKDGQLSAGLFEKLMALADKGITKPEELRKRALKRLPRRHAA